MGDTHGPTPIETPSSIHDPAKAGQAEFTATDRFVVGISNAAAWLFPFLMVAICVQVVIRQMGHNQAWLDDFQWWLYGSAGLIGVAYAVTTNSHVRVDIFYALFDRKKQARTDVFGLTWCFLPFVILCWDVTLGFAITSVTIDEGSDSPNGLHNLWILKIILNLSFVLIALAICGMYVRRMRVLGRDSLGQMLLWAFPSVMFVINLTIYYAFYIYQYVNLPEGEHPRTIGRKAVFAEYEVAVWDIPYTIMMTLAVTILVIGLALVRDARKAK